jgi:hypothetical protein
VNVSDHDGLKDLNMTYQFTFHSHGPSGGQSLPSWIFQTACNNGRDRSPQRSGEWEVDVSDHDGLEDLNMTYQFTFHSRGPPGGQSLPS